MIEIEIISYLILEMALEALSFYSTFFVRSSYFIPLSRLELSYANCRNLTSTVFTQSTLEIKNYFLAHCVVFAVCNGRIVFLLGSYRWYVQK